MSSPRKRLAAAAAVSLSIVAAAGAAGAQAPTKDGAKDAAKDAAPAKPDKAQLAEAKRHMEAGAAFYNDPSGHKCEEAYREFKKAYDLSGSLNALKAMGICALELERDGEAIERLEKYLEGKGAQIEAGDKAQVESDLKALRAAVARVTFKSDRSEVRITDVRTPSKGPQVTNDYALTGEQTLGIHPGRHTFTASAEGAPSLTWTVEIANGGTYDHMFDFSKAAASAGAGGAQPKPAETERPVPVTAFVFGGLTVALAVPTVIFMVRAGGKNSDYEAQNGKLPAAELTELRSDVKSANLVADIFLGATVASLAATGIFYFTRPSRPAEKTGAWAVAPTASRSGGGAVVIGRF
jgi:hypothetical protein